jgi:cell division protein FtsI/penicillin-binding protein 2
MKSSLFWRFRLIHVALLLVGFAIIVQIIHILYSPEADTIRSYGKIYSGQMWEFSPARGEIYDRKGALLAGSKTVYETGVDLTANLDANEVAIAAQIYLGLDYNTVFTTITQPPQGVVYVVLDKFTPGDKVQAFKDFRDALNGATPAKSLSAVYFQPHLERTYPENSLASNVVGFVNRNKWAYYGIEEKYNTLLAGTTVTRWVPVNPNDAQNLPDIPPGATLILTIDREVQAATEGILDNALQTYGADSGVIIVADPKTGEILAMASTPRLNPNEYWTYLDTFPGETPYNRAVSQAYEPGSVVKIFTMAAAIDKGVVRPDTIYNDVTGTIEVGGSTITNWDNAAWGPQDMVGCLQHSLNVCLAWVATQLGQQDFYAYMQSFGLGHVTGIDLAAENPGRLKLPQDSDWYPVDLGTNAFGQGVSITPIQMVMAATALANNGQMMRPHVLRATVQNGVQRDIPIEVVGTPISSATAQTMNSMLSVSLANESSLSLVPGYNIAGKTGTAQIPTPNGYTSDQTNASFIGWGPVDDPKFLVYVWLEKPQTSIWGSETAAPVFKQIVQKLVVLMGIPPDQVRLNLTNGGQ